MEKQEECQVQQGLDFGEEGKTTKARTVSPPH